MTQIHLPLSLCKLNTTFFCYHSRAQASISNLLNQESHRHVLLLQGGHIPEGYCNNPSTKALSPTAPCSCIQSELTAHLSMDNSGNPWLTQLLHQKPSAPCASRFCSLYCTGKVQRARWVLFAIPMAYSLYLTWRFIYLEPGVSLLCLAKTKPH